MHPTLGYPSNHPLDTIDPCTPYRYSSPSHPPLPLIHLAIPFELSNPRPSTQPNTSNYPPTDTFSSLHSSPPCRHPIHPPQTITTSGFVLSSTALLALAPSPSFLPFLPPIQLQLSHPSRYPLPVIYPQAPILLPSLLLTLLTRLTLLSPSPFPPSPLPPLPSPSPSQTLPQTRPPPLYLSTPLRTHTTSFCPFPPPFKPFKPFPFQPKTHSTPIPSHPSHLSSNLHNKPPSRHLVPTALFRLPPSAFRLTLPL